MSKRVINRARLATDQKTARRPIGVATLHEFARHRRHKAHDHIPAL